MSTYREIVGKKIKKVSSDPSSGLDGEMWYNSSTGTLRAIAISNAWVSAANMSTPRADGTGSAGTSTAGFYGGASPPNSGVTEAYNGTGWSANPAMNDDLGQRIGFGSFTAAVVAGGWGPPNSAETEEFNGTAFSNEESLPTATRDMAGFGTQTAGVACCGATGGLVTAVYEYNGESWTGGNAFPTATRNTTGNGAAQTAGILVGGETPSASNQAVTYDGTNWTAITAYPISRAGVMSNGPQTDTIVAGGTPPTSTATTNKWDGTSWTAMPNLASGRYDGGRFGGGGSPDAAVVAGGVSAPLATEEFHTSTNVLTAAAWSSAPALNQGRYWLGSANQAPSSAALGFAGYVTPGNTMYALTEEYDGTSWTEKADLALARSGVAGAGTATAALCIGGYVNAVGTKGETEEFNGSSWSEETNLGTARYGAGGAGTQTAAVCMSGYSYPPASYKLEIVEYGR